MRTVGPIQEWQTKILDRIFTDLQFQLPIIRFTPEIDSVEYEQKKQHDLTLNALFENRKLQLHCTTSCPQLSAIKGPIYQVLYLSWTKLLKNERNFI